MIPGAAPKRKTKKQHNQPIFAGILQVHAEDKGPFLAQNRTRLPLRAKILLADFPTKYPDLLLQRHGKKSSCEL
jgi:hypothetical protein